MKNVNYKKLLIPNTKRSFKPNNVRLKQRMMSPKLKRFLPTSMQVSESICMKQSTELLLQATSK